jgi:hypothetical protein
VGVGVVSCSVPRMDSATTRRLASDYIDRLEQRDWDGLAALLADDLVYEMPQTRERVRGSSAYVRFNAEYPGDWHLSIRRVVADEGMAAVWLDVRTGDQHQDACIWIDVSEHGVIERITDHWPDSYEPPPGRAHLVERW